MSQPATISDLTGAPATAFHPASVPRAIECEAIPVRLAPLHLAIALGGTDGGRSGLGTYVRELLPPLIERTVAGGGSVTAFGHATELAAYRGALHGAMCRRIPFLPLRAGPNALWHLLRAGDEAQRARANVLLLPAANRRLAIGAKVPTVAVVHDLAQLRVDRKYDLLRLQYFRRILLPAFRRQSRLVAISAATRNDLVDALHLSPERIPVVYNGVNAERFKDIDRTSQRAWRIRSAAGIESRPYLLYPSRLEHPAKNHLRLIRAFARSNLAATHTLVLSGADWGAGELIRKAVDDLRLRHAVKLVGYVSGDDMPVLVAAADAVLMLGLHEGFGLPALEALCAGRPVCVSNTGALPEVVGDLGVQCDPKREDSIAQALTRIVYDREVRAGCQKEGPGWAERFTWAKTARGLLDVCHELVP